MCLTAAVTQPLFRTRNGDRRREKTWLQYHMEEEMGLSLGRALSRDEWGGSFKGLGELDCVALALP